MHRFVDDADQLQWGHAEMGVETVWVHQRQRPYMCFNGATPKWAWRLIRLQQHPEGRHASMGPRRNGRGDASLLADGARVERLQWGHAEMGVETWCRFAGSRFKRRFNGATPKWAWRQKAINEMLSLWEASMGPRRNGRGDLLGLRGR